MQAEDDNDQRSGQLVSISQLVKAEAEGGEIELPKWSTAMLQRVKRLL